MTGATRRKNFAFDGFQAGAVFAGLLIAVGVEGLVTTLSWPLGGEITEIINYLIRTGRFQMSTLSPPSLPWLLQGVGGASGLLVLLCGLRLGAWVEGGKQGQGLEGPEVAKKSKAPPKRGA